ncbi:MAG: hypothetical protein AMXMBFR33_18970 [Candidatus Xenobia bacterium]
MELWLLGVLATAWAVEALMLWWRAWPRPALISLILTGFKALLLLIVLPGVTGAGDSVLSTALWILMLSVLVDGLGLSLSRPRRSASEVLRACLAIDLAYALVLVLMAGGLMLGVGA